MLPQCRRRCPGAQETIAEIRVHGNHTTPDADVLGLSGLTTGEPASDARLAEAGGAAQERTVSPDVEVRKRFRSIDDPSDILVMIVVDERAGISEDDLTPGSARGCAAPGCGCRSSTTPTATG